MFRKCQIFLNIYKSAKYFQNQSKASPACLSFNNLSISQLTFLEPGLDILQLKLLLHSLVLQSSALKIVKLTMQIIQKIPL